MSADPFVSVGGDVAGTGEDTGAGGSGSGEATGAAAGWPKVKPPADEAPPKEKPFDSGCCEAALAAGAGASTVNDPGREATGEGAGAAAGWPKVKPPAVEEPPKENPLSSGCCEPVLAAGAGAPKEKAGVLLVVLPKLKLGLVLASNCTPAKTDFFSSLLLVAATPTGRLGDRTMRRWARVAASARSMPKPDLTSSPSSSGLSLLIWRSLVRFMVGSIGSRRRRLLSEETTSNKTTTTTMQDGGGPGSRFNFDRCK